MQRSQICEVHSLPKPQHNWKWMWKTASALIAPGTNDIRRPCGTGLDDTNRQTQTQAPLVSFCCPQIHRAQIEQVSLELSGSSQTMCFSKSLARSSEEETLESMYQIKSPMFYDSETTQHWNYQPPYFRSHGCLQWQSIREWLPAANYLALRCIREGGVCALCPRLSLISPNFESHRPRVTSDLILDWAEADLQSLKISRKSVCWFSRYWRSKNVKATVPQNPLEALHFSEFFFYSQDYADYVAAKFREHSLFRSWWSLYSANCDRNA